MKPKALILASITSLRENIKYALRTMDMDSFEFEDVLQLRGHIEALGKEEIPLVFMDVDARKESRVEELKKVKLQYPHIPILALTGDTKKEKILSLIMAGSSEIIVKPFSEKVLIEKTKKMMMKKEDFAREKIHLDFPALLRKELFKGQKGNYPVSIMIASFFKPKAMQGPNIENEYYSLAFQIKEEMERLLFETDHFLQYGNQTFVGILPFCDQQKRKIVQNKVQQRFKELKKEQGKMKDYQLGINFVTYPDEGEEAKTLTEKLTHGLQRNIENLGRAD